jgi:hypothetical protein
MPGSASRLRVASLRGCTSPDPRASRRANRTRHPWTFRFFPIPVTDEMSFIVVSLSV